MKLHQVSENCFAVENEKNRVCDATSGLINLGGGVVIDTQSDLSHARQMIELFGTVWPGMPKYVINTHEDGDHVWGNQLFEGAEIIAHRTMPDRIKEVADPTEMQHLLKGAEIIGKIHPGVLAIARQLRQDYDFDGINLVLPTTLFDERYTLDLDGTEVHLIYVGAVPRARGHDRSRTQGRGGVRRRRDLQRMYPNGWIGTYEKWLKCLDLIISLNPKVIVPGHGPMCGLEGATEMKGYLEYVREESRRCFEKGLTSLEASKQIDLGKYGTWHAPARLYLNVERAYREFRKEPADAPWDKATSFDLICEVAKAKGIEVEF